MLIIDILKTKTNTAEKAVMYGESIKRNLQKSIIEDLQSKINKIQDNIFDLQDISLETNINSGIKAITREECEKNFAIIIEKEYELELLKRELAIKTKSFNKFFHGKKS